MVRPVQTVQRMVWGGCLTLLLLTASQKMAVAQEECMRGGSGGGPATAGGGATPGVHGPGGGGPQMIPVYPGECAGCFLLRDNGFRNNLPRMQIARQKQMLRQMQQQMMQQRMMMQQLLRQQQLRASRSSQARRLGSAFSGQRTFLPQGAGGKPVGGNQAVVNGKRSGKALSPGKTLVNCEELQNLSPRERRAALIKARRERYEQLRKERRQRLEERRRATGRNTRNTTASASLVRP